MSEAEHDPVNHPKHYRNASGVECIQVVETKSFNVGNAIKYLWRAGEKDDILQDLRKAAWYVSREIERLGGVTSPEFVPETPERKLPRGERKEFRQATIRVSRWDYEAEISPEGVATYENRSGTVVQAGPGYYKVLRYR